MAAIPVDILFRAGFHGVEVRVDRVAETVSFVVEASNANVNLCDGKLQLNVNFVLTTEDIKELSEVFRSLSDEISEP